MQFKNNRQMTLLNKEEEVVEAKVSIEDTVNFWHLLTDVQYGQFKPEALTKLNTWIIGSNGTWLVQKNKTGYYGLKKDEFGIPTLPKVKMPEAFFDMTYGKIPNEILLKVVAFFREIMKRHNNAEAFVQIYWDLEEERYVVHIPKQQVSGGSVRYDADENLNVVNKKRYVFVYEAHSHNSMNAFWSSVDDADEKELRLFGVFGHLDKQDYKCLHRFFVGEDQVDVELNLIFDIPETKAPEQYVVTHKDKQYLVSREELVLDQKPKYIYQSKQGDKLYIPIENVVAYKEPTPQVDVPDDWYNSVNVPLPPRQTYRNSHYGHNRKVWKNDHSKSRNWDGGSGYWPEIPDTEEDPMDFKRTEQNAKDVESSYEASDEGFVEMAQQIGSLASEIAGQTLEFDDMEATFVFLQSLDEEGVLANLEKALKNYHHYLGKESQGPTDGKY